MCWSGFASMQMAASHVATRAIPRGSNGLCWRPPSKAISLPTSRYVISRSTVRIRGKIFNMRTLLLRSLFASPVTIEAPAPEQATLAEIGRELETRARKLFGRSITIREIDAGSCNGCELEIHALNNAVYDVERFGIKFAASPRHADVLMVTGPVTHNMKVALERT